MRVCTWNLNGLRAALKKGLMDHVRALDADVYCFQEIRARPEQLDPDFRLPDAYAAFWHPATSKAGWSGTAVWTRVGGKLLDVGLDGTDADGRVQRLQIGDLTLVNAYMPSGSAGPERQALKDAFMPAFLRYSAPLVKQVNPVLIVGDYNTAPGPRDVHDPKRASKLSGYLPHERQWFAELLSQGWIDTVRVAHGDVQGPYSWWSRFGRALVEDRGWRIDHALVNAAAHVTGARIDRAAGLAISDHAPVIVEIGAL